jgi:hypothetical protein
LTCAYVFPLHSKPTLLLPEKHATIPRSSLVLWQSLPGHCQVVAFPLCYLLSQGDCSLFIALSYSLCRSGVAISTAMAAGLASVSSIQMAGKPPVGTDCRQELSRAPLLLPDRDCRPFRSCRLSGGRVKRPVASIVRCFPSSERGVVCSQLPTNLCPVQETPLLAYTLPLQGELTFVLCMGFQC